MKIKWPLVVLFIIIGWWIFLRKKKQEGSSSSASASASTPLGNLQTDLLSSQSAAQLVLQVVSNNASKNSGDVMVDADPVCQTYITPGEFIIATKPQSEKILGKPIDQVYVSDQIGTGPKMRRDNMWWPERMYQDAPEWMTSIKNFTPCDCGCGEQIPAV